MIKLRVFAFASILLLAGCVGQKDGNDTRSSEEIDNRGYIVKIGDKAPDFTVETIHGVTFTLSENKGKVIVLQFTASWCRVCHIKMPHLENNLWLPLKDKDFILIGIDRDEPFEVVKEFAKKTGVTYPLALDPGGKVFHLYAEKNAGITRNVVIDKNGKIAFLTRLYDEEEHAEMKKAILKLLN